MAWAAAPILPVKVDRVIYTGPFVEELQRALVRAGYDVGPAGIDGKYGPDTAAALAAFQSDHPDARDRDQLPGYIPYQVAGCHTYRALGIDVLTSYCRGGVSADGATCNAVMAADARGEINLKCIGVPIGQPRPVFRIPGLDWRLLAFVGGAGLLVGIVGYTLAKGRR